MDLQAQAPQYNATLLTADIEANVIAQGINNLGEVVGGYFPGSSSSAFLYSNGTMIDLGPMIGGRGSQANDINDSSQIVGWMYPEMFENFSAFVFFLVKGVKHIGPPQGVASYASAINNAGQIIGSYTAPH